MQLPLDLNLIQHLLNSSTATGDLNDLTTTGFYYVENPVNAPTSAWPHVIVNANDNKTKVVQLALPDKGAEGLYYRCYSDAAWSDWQHVGNPTVNVGELTKIPSSGWVPGSGISIDNDYYFRGITVINLGDNALVYVNLQYNTTVTLQAGWNTLMTFPTSYLSSYQGAGTVLPLVFDTSDTSHVGDCSIAQGSKVTVYLAQDMPANTTFNIRALVLLSKDTNLLN